MSKYVELAEKNAKVTPQTVKTPGRNDEVKNVSGGFVFEITDWNKLERFLILGTEGGSFYVNEKDMTKQSCSVLDKLLKTDHVKVIDLIAKISDENLCIKNDTCVFALASAAVSLTGEARRYALSKIQTVCRASTDFFSFVDSYKKMGGGFGSSVTKALGKWYTDKSADSLSNQLIKYRQRNGWTHSDVLRLSHPKPLTDAHNLLFKFAKDEALVPANSGIRNIDAYFAAKSAKTEKEICKLVLDNSLPREAIPNQWLNSPKVWEALLQDMPATAFIRNLGIMSGHGIFSALSEAEKLAVKKLSDTKWLTKSRVHPLTILLANKIYGSGRSVQGSSSWSINKRVQDALWSAFYSSFDSVEPTSDNYLLGVDVSTSMTWVTVNGQPLLTAAEAAVALAMVLNKMNENSLIMGFSHNFIDLNLTWRDDFRELHRKVFNLGFGATNCALPMQYALQNKIPIDKFVIITDNETNTGSIKPTQALSQYRNKMDRNSGLVVCATSVNGFTIADPKDPKQLDICGFSPVVPKIIATL